MKQLMVVLAMGFLLAAGTPAAWAEEAPKVSLTFTNAEVRDVLTALAGVGETSIIADDTVTGKITLRLQDVPFDTALELVTKAKGLAVQRVGPVIVVASPEKLHRSFDTVQIIRLQYARAEEVIGLLGLVTGKGKADSGDEGKKSNAHGGTAENANGVTNAAASSSATYTVAGPALVKTEAIERIQGAGRLRADMETNSILFYGSEEEASLIRKLVAGIDVPYRQVTVEAQVLAITKSGAKNLGVEWNWQATPQYASGDTSDTGTAASTANVGTISYGRSPAGTPYQFLYQAQINALVSRNDARLLARPKVTTLNGRAARIHIGDQIPVAATTVSGGATTTSTEYKDAGIILQYTPRIDADGQICAALYTGVSTPVYVADLKAYRIAIREAETEVRMKNGETIVIGGLLNKNDVENTSKVPFLGDLPILGKLFQNHSSANDETEIVIFLTAKIVE